MAAPAAPASVATAAAITFAARENDALQGPLAGSTGAAVAAAAAGPASPPVAAAASRGQDGQRAVQLADGYLGELARASGASLGAVTARSGPAAVPPVGGTRHGRAQQPGAEPCLRGRCPGASGTAVAVAAGRSARAVQRAGAVIDGERGRQDRELVSAGLGRRQISRWMRRTSRLPRASTAAPGSRRRLPTLTTFRMSSRSSRPQCSPRTLRSQLSPERTSRCRTLRIRVGNGKW